MLPRLSFSAVTHNQGAENQVIQYERDHWGCNSLSTRIRRTESWPVLKELLVSYGHDKNHLTYQQKDWNNKKQTELWIYLINLLALWPGNEQLWISPILCCVKSGRTFLLFQQIALLSRQTSCKMQKQYKKLINYFCQIPSHQFCSRNVLCRDIMSTSTSTWIENIH
jgi:hypothetical protein